VHGIVEALFRRYVRQGMSPEEAFLQSSESITGNIVKIISKEGIKAVYEKMAAFIADEVVPVEAEFYF